MKMAASQRENGKFTTGQKRVYGFPRRRDSLTWSWRSPNLWSISSWDFDSRTPELLELLLLHCVLHYDGRQSVSGRKMRSATSSEEDGIVPMVLDFPSEPQMLVWWLYVCACLWRKISPFWKSQSLALLGVWLQQVWEKSRIPFGSAGGRVSVSLYLWFSHTIREYQHACQSCQRMNRNYTNVDQQLSGWC